jgi:hypothetical protein
MNEEPVLATTIVAGEDARTSSLHMQTNGPLLKIFNTSWLQLLPVGWWF